MNNKPFIINNRFWIYPDQGLIKQQEGDKETRVEPRLMHLLCLLVMSNYEVVGRGLLITHVWHNQEKAGEELAKAIAYLRKLLDDSTKPVIETVPNKGYILHAAINFDLDEEKSINQVVAGNRQLYWVIAAVLLAVIITCYFIFR